MRGPLEFEMERDSHHQIANELGIAIGMIQLAIKKLENGNSNQDSGLRHYLVRADAALARLRPLMAELKKQDSEPRTQ